MSRNKLFLCKSIIGDGRIISTFNCYIINKFVHSISTSFKISHQKAIGLVVVVDNCARTVCYFY